jgi:iron complex outermembrane receptor protein
VSATYALDKAVNALRPRRHRLPRLQRAGRQRLQQPVGGRPETNTSFEAGIKADLFDRRARLAFSVFSYTVKDLQLTAVGGAANANILLNAKKATGQGFELDLQAFLTDSCWPAWAWATTTPRSRTRAWPSLRVRRPAP